MKKVLIVDDDFVLLDVLIESLHKYTAKFEVVTAENGKVAKDVLEKEDISLLVTDIMMPEVDGLALLAHVNDKHYAIPCFVMTAYATPEIKQLIPKDVLNFFSKPFPADKLGPAIEEALEQGIPSGVISGISVASFLLLVEMEKKTCLFEIVLPDEKKGLCYFNKGVLFNAAFEGMKGEVAVLSLIQNEKARFRFKPLPEKKLAKRIDKGISTLIKEAKSQRIKEEPETGREVQAQKEKPGHRLELTGSFYSETEQVRGEMTVVNMSLTHILCKMLKPQMVPDGSNMEVEFILDDKPKSCIRKDVIVLNTNGDYLRCSFVKPEHYDRLGPYLHFNYLDKQSL